MLSQVIIQMPDRARCEALCALPATMPALLVFCSDGSTVQDTLAEELKTAVRIELEHAGGSTSAIPCCGYQSDMANCRAPAEAKRRKVLVVVCDGSTPVDMPPSVTRPSANDEMSAVIPVVPLANRTTFSAALGDLSIWNAEFWKDTIAETVPAILARAGLTVERPRVFISYRQTETAALATQLFDGLSHKNCDVFLDHFRIEAGVDFQARLTEELGDKSIFVLLESNGTLDSKWVRYEISKATALGIGRVALTVPGVPRNKLVEAITMRLALGPDDFEDALYQGAGSALTIESLERTITFILREHMRAVFWRRASLQNSLLSALRSFGVTDVVVDYFGALHVGGTATPRYIVWLSPNPPGLAEFYGAFTGGTGKARGVVIGPSQTLAAIRRRQTSWLASRSNLIFVDEGWLRPAARRIANGTLA